jgi:hypothetical protein
VKKYAVKDLMVPLSEYATVPKGSTLHQAVLALEKAQEEFDHTKYKHRAVLIMDAHKRVIGKLGHMDALRALEPKDRQSTEMKELAKFGFGPEFVGELRKQQRLQAAPLDDLCKKAVELKVEDFMQATAEGEFIDEEASLDIAIHQLVMGNLLSLLATKEKNITGILRLTDVIAAVFDAIKECGTTDGGGS